MTNSVLKNLYHIIWYLLAGVMIGLAILITLIRFALTETHKYPQEAQEWLSQLIGTPIQFESVTAKWGGWTPQLSFFNLTILDEQGEDIISHFKSARISIRPLKSLLHRKIITGQLTISGMQIDIIWNQAGDLRIRQVGTQHHYGGKDGKTALWYLIQANTHLKDLSIRWIDQQHHHDIVEFSNTSIRIRTDQARHSQIDIYTDPSTPGHNELQLHMDITGNLLTPSWSGTLYAEMDHHLLMRILPDLGLEFDPSASKIRLWSEWEQARPQTVYGRVNYQDLVIRKNANHLSIPELDLTFLALKKNHRDWHIQIKTKALRTDASIWPPSVYRIQASLDGDHYHYAGLLGYVHIDDAQTLLRVLDIPGIDPVLETHNIHGRLTELTFSYLPQSDGEAIARYAGRFSQLKWTKKNTRHTWENLSGSLSGDRQHIHIEVDSDTAILTDPTLFIEPIAFSKINGDIHWQQDMAGRTIRLSSLLLQARDLPFSLSGNIILSDNTSPHLDLIASLSDTDINTAMEYLPKVLPPRLDNWLKTALTTGKIESATLLIRGRLDEYPYADGSGILKGKLKLTGSTLRYHKQWPPIEALDVGLTIVNNTLTARSELGKIYDVPIQSVRLVIEDLLPDELDLAINGELVSHPDHIMRFIRESPLHKKPLFSKLMQLNIEGNTALALTINKKLATKRGKKYKPQVQGSIELFDAKLIPGKSSTLGFELHDLNGQLAFSNTTITGKSLHAIYNRQAVTLDIHKDSDSPIQWTLSGKADTDLIMRHIEKYFPNIMILIPDLQTRIDGQGAWTWQLNIDAGKKHRPFLLQSELTGIGIDLPAPLGKEKAETRQLLIAGDLAQKRLDRIQYGQDLFLERSHPTAASTPPSPSSNADLPQAHPDQQMVWKGSLKTLDLDNWRRIVPKTAHQEAGLSSHKATLALTIDRLQLLSQAFNEVKTTVTALEQRYRIEIDSDKAHGTIVIPHNLSQQGIVMDMQYLHLKKYRPQHIVDPSTLPAAFILNVDRLVYEQADRGTLKIQANSIDKGLDIPILSLDHPDMQIAGTARWQIQASGHHSRFTGDIHAKKLDTLLTIYGYAAPNIIGQDTHIHLDVNWPGPLRQPSLNKLNGNIAIRINEGELLAINPVSNRLFGLLSLQALARYLFLDFSSLFKNSLRFDAITGAFSLDNDNAYTNNLSLQSPSVDIIVSGHTDLIKQEYNQFATVTPKLSNTLPVISALLGGPVGIGVGTMLFLGRDKLPTPFGKLLNQEYKISGSWSDPEVTRINQATIPKADWSL